MKQKKLAIAVGVVGVAALALSIGAVAEAHHHDDPTDAEIAFAVGTSDLMTNTVVAALVQEIGETTPANVSVLFTFTDVGPVDEERVFHGPERSWRSSGRAVLRRRLSSHELAECWPPRGPPRQHPGWWGAPSPRAVTAAPAGSLRLVVLQAELVQHPAEDLRLEL